MLVFATRLTSRLRYITGFIGEELFDDGIELTNDRDEFLWYNGPKINYSSEDFSTEACWLPPVSLLFEQGIIPQRITCCVVEGLQAFYKTTGGDFAFDMFAAAFYLISRYEEYLPSKPDEYGRFDHTRSLAFTQKFLDRPLVNNWFVYFRQVVSRRHPGTKYREQQFRFLPTYDIDIAWSYRHKGLWRNLGGFVRDAIDSRWHDVHERWQVLFAKRQDPFDSYAWLRGLHQAFRLSPVYFFLVAARQKGYDKNINPRLEAFATLVNEHKDVTVGIHPSWQSGDSSALLLQEVNTLARLYGKPLEKCRMHYIRFSLPLTFRRLVEAGITEEYSMGYGSINGFRASVASPFYWYDLEKETQTSLRLFPFCFMDANAFFEQNLDAESAYHNLVHYYKAVKDIDGLMITIWHNNFLGTDARFAGWRDVYQRFISALESDKKQ